MRKKTAPISLESLPGNDLRDYRSPIDEFISTFLLHISGTNTTNIGHAVAFLGD